MAMILFDQGKKLGEISEWTVASNEPVYKTFLGKTVLSTAASDDCSFTSPKPVNRKSVLTVVEDGKKEFSLQIKSVVGGTAVVAKILKTTKI